MTGASPPRAETAVVDRGALAAVTLVGRLSPTARLLIACRAVRSLGQGALVADFAFYLSALHWTPVQMGAVYMAGLMVGAGLTLFSGPLSDGFGRKPFLVAYGLAQVAAATAALCSSAPIVLIPAAIVGAFGRGANGAAGPFGPVEQAWLSDGLAEADFGAIYSLNAAVGYGGMAVGALFAALPSWWDHWLPGALRYRPLFLLGLVGALITLALLARMTDARAAPAGRSAPRMAEVTAQDWRQQRGMLLRLIGINSLNGLAIGMIGPFMAFWFHLRFGLGPSAIGPVMALGFVAALFSSLWTGWLTRRLGTVTAVVVMRCAGLALFVLLPFAPSYGLAATCYVLRAAFNRGTAGARQAVGMKLVGAGRRGLAASLNTISMQVPRALGPMLGGWLLETELLALPFLFAAALQAVYLALYGVAFRRVD
jgi:MFS family permease